MDGADSQSEAKALLIKDITEGLNEAVVHVVQVNANLDAFLADAQQMVAIGNAWDAFHAKASLARK